MMWVQITAGQGPVECSRAVWHISKIFQKECEELKVDVELLNGESDREKKSLKSVLLKVLTDVDIRSHWEGPVCWQAPSPFRPHHKRKNWYVNINFYTPQSESYFDPAQIKIEALKGSGPGGQHVNKSCTAIRATYLPLNVSVFCHEERSQIMNKKLALARLEAMVKNINQQDKNALKQSEWLSHYQLMRGDPVRTFKGRL
jgi:peptide chain release factor